MSKEEFELSSDDMAKLVLAMMDGAPLSTAVNFSQESLEAAYALAYSNYKAKNFADAEKLFSFLTIMDSMDPRFSLGLAGCFQAKGEYEKAIDMYQISMIGDAINDPSPMYYAAVCYMKLDKKEEAIAALELAKKFSSDPKYTHINKQATDMLEIVKQIS